MTDNIRIIKKYPNRRLYDTAASKYITLDDIKQLVLQRIEFRVIEVGTNADITKSTLLQIISEHEDSATPIFTVEVLQQLIRSYSNNMQNILSRYLEEGMAFFIKQQEHFKGRHPQTSQDMPNPFNWMADLMETQRQFWQSLSIHMFEEKNPEDNKDKK